MTNFTSVDSTWAWRESGAILPRIPCERVMGCLHSGRVDLCGNSKLWIKLWIGNVFRSDKEDL
jgi:hypothetical protein